MNLKKWMDRTAIAIVMFAIGVVVVGKLYATQQSMAKFTGATLGATDTVVANANFLIDSSVSIGAFWLPPTNTYTLTNTGTNVVTCNNSGDVWKDSTTGIKTYPSGIILNGASGTMKLAATSGAVTATSCPLTLNGTNAMVLTLNKAHTFKSIELGPSAKVTSNGTTTLSVLSSGTPLTLGTTATFTSTSAVAIGRTTSGPLYALDATSVWNGTGTIYPYANTAGITVTVPAVTYTGSGNFLYSDSPALTGWTIQFTGTQNYGTAALDLYAPSTGTTGTYDCNGQNFTCGVFKNGNLAASMTTTYNYSSGTFTILSYNLVITYNSGTTNVNFMTSNWICSTGWQFPSTHTITGTAATTSVTFTGVGTTTSNGKTFPGNVVINSAGVARTFADKFKCDGNYTATAGRPVFLASGLDTIVGDVALNQSSTDTTNFNNDSSNIGGSYTGNLRIKNHLRTNLYGTALCNFTSNSAKLNRVVVNGTTRTKQMKLIDRYTSQYLTVSTGNLNTNEMDCFADSAIIINDSVATVLGDTISSRRITYGASAKPMIGTPMLLYFGLALADTMRDSVPTQSLGKLVVNKTGSNVTFANAGHYDTMQVINGSIAMNAATDTQYTKGLSITTTSTCVLTAPIVVTDSIYILAGATVTYSGVGKIIKQTCSAAQGGNAARIYYPAIAPISYADAPWTDTVGKTSTHAITLGGCSLGKDSIVTITALPTGYSYSKTTGLISWAGTGAAQASANYIIRAYGNAKTDSASVTVGITIYQIPSKRKRRGGNLSTSSGLIIGTD